MGSEMCIRDRFNTRYITASVLNWRGLVGNRYIWPAIIILLVLQLGFTYWAPMQQLFGTAAIDLVTWGCIVLVASSVLVLVELEKLIIRRVELKKNVSIGPV